MNWIQVITAIGLIFSAGFGISLLLTSRRRPVGWIEVAALSWLFGTAFVTLSQFLLGLVLSHGILWGLVMILCLALGVIGWKRAKGRIAPFPRPGSAWEFGVLALLICQAAFVCWLSTRQAFGCDGLLVWEIKARAAFLNGGIPSRQFFADPMLLWCHQNYPLYLPLIESWIYAHCGECNQSSLLVIGPLFYLAGISLLGVATTRLTRLPLVGITTASLPFFLPFVFQRHGGVLTGYSDWPLGLFYLASISYLLAFIAEKERTDLRLFLACSLLIPWIKVEGTILWLVLMLTGILFAWKELKMRALLFVFPGGILLVLWMAFTHWMKAVALSEFLPMSWQTIHANQDRVKPIFELFTILLGSIANWSLFFPLLGLAILYLLVVHRERSALFVASTVLIPLLMFPGIYLFSSWNYHQHIATSLPRLLFQLSLTGFLVIGIGLGKFLSQRR